MVSQLLARVLRRHEAARLRLRDFQRREGHWAIVIGKGGHIRTVPVPDWMMPGYRLPGSNRAGFSAGPVAKADPGVTDADSSESVDRPVGLARIFSAVAGSI